MGDSEGQPRHVPSPDIFTENFSENAYAAAREPKELHVVEDAEHIDLYDRVGRIPFDKLETFFKSNLK